MTEHYERIRNLSEQKSDKWLYAAIRAASTNEPAHLQLILRSLSKKTPHEIMRMFPPSKDYKGAKWGSKDYFFTMDALRKFNLDKPLGKHIMAFLWDYMEPHLMKFCICLERVRSKTLRGVYGEPPRISLANMCRLASGSYIPICNRIFDTEDMEGVYVGFSGISLDYSALKHHAEILKSYFPEDIFDIALNKLKIDGMQRAHWFELDALSSADARRLRYLDPDLAQEARNARKRRPSKWLEGQRFLRSIRKAFKT